MESRTLREWLRQRGRRFYRHKSAKGTVGIGAITVRLGDREAELPPLGSHKVLPPETVNQIVDSLGLDRNELPGPKSRT